MVKATLPDLYTVQVAINYGNVIQIKKFWHSDCHGIYI